MSASFPCFPDFLPCFALLLAVPWTWNHQQIQMCFVGDGSAVHQCASFLKLWAVYTSWSTGKQHLLQICHKSRLFMLVRLATCIIDIIDIIDVVHGRITHVEQQFDNIIPYVSIPLSMSLLSRTFFSVYFLIFSVTEGNLFVFSLFCIFCWCSFLVIYS